MRGELARLHSRLRVTMIYVTHDQAEAMTLGDRIVVLKDGRIQQIAAPMELYDRPVNSFVAGFIGSPAMNFLPLDSPGSGLAGVASAGQTPGRGGSGGHQAGGRRTFSSGCAGMHLRGRRGLREREDHPPQDCGRESPGRARGAVDSSIDRRRRQGRLQTRALPLLRQGR